MNSHVIELLAAYHDGELPSNRRQQVEKHLQACPSCRAELAAFEALSSLLKADAVPEQTPLARFAAQVQLRLPRASLSRAGQQGERPPRWALGAPLALIIVWAFLEAALWVTAFILTAGRALGPRAALFNNWMAIEGLLETSVHLLLFDTILLMGTTILWSAWLAFWLAWEKNQNESIKEGVI